MVEKVLCKMKINPKSPRLVALGTIHLVGRGSVVTMPNTRIHRAITCGVTMRTMPRLTSGRLLPVCVPVARSGTRLRLGRRGKTGTLRTTLSANGGMMFLALKSPAVCSAFSCIRGEMRTSKCRAELMDNVASFYTATTHLGVPLAR